MAKWSSPVYDRTQADVDYARQQLSNKINNMYYKGCFNVGDISRIENNTKYLSDILVQLYYFNKVSIAQWYEVTLPDVIAINRIINNINTLWEKYGKPPDAIALPNNLVTFEQINNIEKNIHLIREMLDDMIESFRECGTFDCGEE
jgi:hypothetical protein